jgi:hypothetical protein
MLISALGSEAWSWGVHCFGEPGIEIGAFCGRSATLSRSKGAKSKETTVECYMAWNTCMQMTVLQKLQ